MLDVQMRLLNQAIKSLDLVNAKYKVITPCGLEYGQLEVVPDRPPTKSRGLPRYGRMETRDVFVSHLKDMKMGDVKVIDCGKYDPRVISRDISSYCANWMGAGVVSVLTNVEKNVVEVLALQDFG